MHYIFIRILSKTSYTDSIFNFIPPVFTLKEILIFCNFVFLSLQEDMNLEKKIFKDILIFTYFGPFYLY